MPMIANRHMSEIWFPATDSLKIVGRFVDVEVELHGESRKQGRKVTAMRPVLEAKQTGSWEISASVVKPHNEDEFRARFPGAWEHYLAHREQTEPEGLPAGITGTPLKELAFLNNLVGALNLQGLHTVEQLAGLDDKEVLKFGPNAKKWRTKARAYVNDPTSLRHR